MTDEDDLWQAQSAPYACKNGNILTACFKNGLISIYATPCDNLVPRSQGLPTLKGWETATEYSSQSTKEF